MRSHSIATDSPIKKIVAEKIDKDDESAVRFMKCAYFLAKNELPKSLFSATIEFVDALGIEIQRASKPEYTHHTSVGEFQAACAKTISTDTVEHMKEGSGLYSKTIDESTDRGNKKRLILYAEFVNRDFKKETKFICNSEITTATADAETIVNVVLAELRNKGIDISGMIGISTDGANLKDRFADNGVLSLFQIFVLACIVKAEREGAQTLLKFGLKELNDLLDKYEKSLKLDRDDCVSEYKQYRRLVLGSYSTLNLSACVEAMFRNYQQIIPNVCKLLEVAVLIPMSSVPCERGFSTQNRILTRFRTRLSTQALNDLMRISEDGPSFKQFDFNRAVTTWKKEKVRKLYA